MGSIYKITNTVNGKIYIGKTCFSLEKRFKQHKHKAKFEPEIKRPLYNAIRKYGEDNFIIELIETCEESIINDREKYWIKELNSRNRKIGYNVSPGGDGCSWQYSEKRPEVVQKIKETKIKNGTYGKYYGPRENPMKGKHIKKIPSKEELLQDILTPLTSKQIAQKYNLSADWTIPALLQEYFNKSIIEIRHEYGVKLPTSQKQIDAFNKNRKKDVTGENNAYYKHIDKDMLLYYIRLGYSAQEIADTFKISKPTLTAKCKEHFGKTFRQIKMEVNHVK